jgi:hypothetical protein
LDGEERIAAGFVEHQTREWTHVLLVAMHGTRDEPAHIIQFERREHDLAHPRPSPAQRIQRQH